jgi:hypothetical protein
MRAQVLRELAWQPFRLAAAAARRPRAAAAAACAAAAGARLAAAAGALAAALPSVPAGGVWARAGWFVAGAGLVVRAMQEDELLERFLSAREDKM